MSTETPSVIDVSEEDFAQEVLERSRDVPVVVDFWAPWCGPCRTLGPILERLAETHAGEFQLVKLNTDENPNISAQYRIQGIPAVKAFRDGGVVDEFVGALPESQVKAWLARILPTQADRLVAEGEELAAAGYGNAADDRFRQALAIDVNHPKAIASLGRLLVASGNRDEALSLFRRMPADPEIARLLAETELLASGGTDLDALRARAVAKPNDAAAQHDLGVALAAAGDHEAGLEALLASVRIDRHWDEDAARKAMLRIFQVLGDDNALTAAYRRRLSNLLF